jgi:prevent-host-death family protein
LDERRFGKRTIKKELMMDKIMPTAPISDVHLNQKELLNRINDSPVVLMSRSQPAAVLVSVEEWNRTARAMEIMLDLIRKDRPWFSLPLYTLSDILQEVGIVRDANGALVFPTNQQEPQKEGV